MKPSTQQATAEITMLQNSSTYGGIPTGSPFGKLFIELLQDIYWAEQEFTGALQRMYDAATTGILRRTFKEIQNMTLHNVTRLERVFAILGKPAEAKQSEAIKRLVNDAERAINETPDHSITRDTSLIQSAQKIENYEIETYNNLLHTALALGHNEAAYILENILRDEEHTDLQLAEMAEKGIHPVYDLDLDEL